MGGGVVAGVVGLLSGVGWHKIRIRNVFLNDKLKHI